MGRGDASSRVSFLLWARRDIIIDMTHTIYEPTTIRPSDQYITLNNIRLRYWQAGESGSPVLLLHGSPQTHVMWHKIAPRLAKEFTVVAADLRGYGDSSKPADSENHSNYSKRSMALDQVEVVRHFGFDKLPWSGTTAEGGLGTAWRSTTPDRIMKLAVLDIVPTYTLLHSVNNEVATAFYHWFFLIQPSPFPETLIADNVEFYLKYMMFRDMSSREIPRWMNENAFAEYLRCCRDVGTIRANCEDYRAGASIDMEHDEEDLKRKIASKNSRAEHVWTSSAPAIRLK